MHSALPATAQPPDASASVRRQLRRAEWVIVTFFAYLATLGFVRSLSAAQVMVLCTLPFTLWFSWRVECSASRPWSRVLREWSSLGVILTAYWILDWFTAPPMLSVQAQWVRWDRMLLDDIGLRQLIESCGSVLPALLETVYLGLYAVPVAALGIVHGFGERNQTYRFLCVLFLGTLSAYAMLPLFPVRSPRVAFPDQDLPHFYGTARQINVWLLDHLDISTSVFPSGHVAVAFSTAFGLLAVFRHRRRMWIPAFVAAGIVYAATIYGRYHYSVDGLASIALAAAAWRIAEVSLIDD